MPRIRPKNVNPQLYLRYVYQKAEQDIINEIFRKRAQGYVDYAEVAALERVQKTLQDMVDDSWTYVPKMIEKRFYKASGYENARSVARGDQRVLMEQLVDNLMGEIVEASTVAYETSRKLYTLARLDEDELRKVALTSTIYTEAVGKGAVVSAKLMEVTIRNHGITAFVDKAGRQWSLTDYCNMATRTTARQAEVAAVLSKDEGHDLYQIVKIGSTCPVCAVYEGRVYSKSGADPNYPPLALAFGKIDPMGADDLSNTFLNIHPNCLVPGGFVLGEGVVSESQRLYSGKIIQLTTSRGNEISVTPNHPILTERGFVAAGRLIEGDKIVEASGEYIRLIGKAPDNIDVPTAPEEIFHALVEAVGGATCSVKGAAKQFHGDGIANSKVNIVFADGFRDRKRKAPLHEEILETDFPATKTGWPHLLSKRSFGKIFVRAFHSAYSIMRGLGLVGRVERVSENGEQLSDLGHRASTDCGNLGKGKSSIVEGKKALKLFSMRLLKRFRNITKALCVCFRIFNNSTVDAGALDCLLRDAEALRDLRVTEPLLAERLESLFCNNGFVISELAHKESSFYSGYVYNFETKYGYYIYNNIVTHNCLHSLIPFTEMGKTEKQIEAIRKFSNPATNPLNHDPRTKKQIEAYREKERNRARLLRDRRQFEEYKAVLGKNAPGTFTEFRDLKYNKPEKWEYTKGLESYLSKYPTSDKRYYDVKIRLKEKGVAAGLPLPVRPHRAYILPEGKRDPYHIMHRMLERGVTDDDIRSYAENAKVMFSQWRGQRRLYIGEEGSCIITKDSGEWKYKTAWTRADNDENTDFILKVLKDVGL